MMIVTQQLTAKSACYEWNLDHDCGGFFDRFLDGMTEQPFAAVNAERALSAHVKAWFEFGGDVPCALELMPKWFPVTGASTALIP
jgi:hypothetical protein